MVQVIQGKFYNKPKSSPSDRTVSTVASSTSSPMAGSTTSSPMAVTEDVLGQVEVDGADGNLSTPPDDFVCMGCGNERDLCHQKLFGTFLIQDALTLYNNSLLSEKDVDEKDIRKMFKDKYPERLQAFVMFQHYEYDEKLDYDLPLCLVEGALKTACNLIESKKTLALMETKRRYGASYKYFLFNSEHLELMNEL